ncbi:uncharacterized protein LOC133195224 [Saccostrea echinata]|uniref:uncharacterized protein LOC133195224 n=1 Tax=Saccostrea echinata TaxID=191078 RepID=UPI002A80E2CA|nr:uncharacterized protein LOC133195224 [Saccostrea echinata]
MLKKKFFKRKPKTAGKKGEVRAKQAPIYRSETRNVYDYIAIDPEYKFGPSGYTPLREKKPLPNPTEKNAAEGKIFSKDAILDLPLQRVPSNRRIEDLDEKEYGYTSFGKVHRQKKKDTNWEDAFFDALEFLPYQKLNHSPALSKFFFEPQEKYKVLSIEEVCREINNASDEIQQDMVKYITACLLPSLKQKYKMSEVFNLLSCKNKLVRNLCINELIKMIMVGDQRKYSQDCMLKLYEIGTVQLFTVIGETKKSFSIFQSLIQLGIIFNCFIYLRAIEAIDDWNPCIQHVKSKIQSKIKRVAQRTDQSVHVFAKTADCIFNLQEVDFDESFLIGEDMNTFLSVSKKKESKIYIDGMAALFHTGNLMLRQESKFHCGVQQLRIKSLHMNDSSDEELVKWYHRLLGLFIVHLLEKEHPGVKQEILEKCEDELLSILNCTYFHPESFCVSKSLLFHHSERIRTRYKDIFVSREKGMAPHKSVTEDHIEVLLTKCVLILDRTPSESPIGNDTFERKQCSIYYTDASITCIVEDFKNNSRDLNMYDNTLSPYNDIVNLDRQDRLKNELEVLKEIESKEIHRNVARLLAFNASFPCFYIKERLPGDNLQRRLLTARDKKKIIPIIDLIGIIVQAVQAVIYVHSCGCLVRDITTASYGCLLMNNEYFIKLKNFEMAAKPSDFPSGGIVTGLIDLDFEGVPTRWAAPESLLGGHYSIYSDVWSVNILADEILNYAAWPYSDISDSDIEDMVTNIVFTHLKPQGFNRPRRVQGLILEGLASEPEQRLKLEALRERLLDISDSLGDAQSYNVYDTYSGIEGTHAKVYDIPPLTNLQMKADSKFARGIPKTIRKYRELDEDPQTVFASEVAENNSKQREEIGLTIMEISSVKNYKIEDEVKLKYMMKVSEIVSDDFLKFTYNRLKEIDSSKMCVEPWPPATSITQGSKRIHYRFPKSTHLLDLTLHKERGETITPYIELLYELAKHVDSLHSAGWIFRCLRAKHVWILETKKKDQTIVVPKFGKYLVIESSQFDAHLEQVKVEGSPADLDGIQWLPIEAIKAGLYSKESDVYAYGMVTWEVMSAFGQQGVVYDQDEEQELTCIPFNYQRSENILQHLIEGYIPEKPIKCPEWFYQEVTRPCLLHQKIDRPSMKTILQILETRLGKAPPRQDRYLPLRSGKHKAASKSLNAEDYDDLMYEDINPCDLEEESSFHPSTQRRVLPPPLPVSYCNDDDRVSEQKIVMKVKPSQPNIAIREKKASIALSKPHGSQNIVYEMSEEKNSGKINRDRSHPILGDIDVAADFGSKGYENTEEKWKTGKTMIRLSSLPPPRPKKSRAHKRDNNVRGAPNSAPKVKNQPGIVEYSRTSKNDAFKTPIDPMDRNSDPSFYDNNKSSDLDETNKDTRGFESTGNWSENSLKLGSHTGNVGVDSLEVEKGSDFFGKLSTETTKRKVLLNPQNKNEIISIQYANQERVSEKDKTYDDMRKGVHNQRSPVYVNNSLPERKPDVPPRKPLK